VFLPGARAVTANRPAADVSAGELVSNQAGGEWVQDKNLEAGPGMDNGKSRSGGERQLRKGACGEQKR
jgi:hypothetical protein